MKRLLVFVLVSSLTGCSLPDLKGPVTEVTVSPINKTIKFRDTKDNRLSVKDLHAKTKDGGEFNVGELLIENQSSSVIREQLTLMKEYTEQMKVSNEALRLALQEVKTVFSGLVRMGGGPVSGVIESLGTLPPTSRPAN